MAQMIDNKMFLYVIDQFALWERHNACIANQHVNRCVERAHLFDARRNRIEV